MVFRTYECKKCERTVTVCFLADHQKCERCGSEDFRLVMIED
jgi:DNA-directed RNA polymerase subunit RPC12/RpoP